METQEQEESKAATESIRENSKAGVNEGIFGVDNNTIIEAETKAKMESQNMEIVIIPEA